ncbi:alpha/beta hydrolase family protein [Roseateles sp. UC29_93]|uniref:alpha/beta hydrolase family protein n=1 Tax=Roseateles sp. UC29_93 TaxID=3350177 RepID=UPI00366A5AD2
MTRTWRWTALAASAAAAFTALLIGCASRPPASGPDLPAQPDAQLADDGSHHWQDFDWTDPARHRAVPVRVYWPSGAAPAGGWPVVVFSHGMGGSRRGYSYLGSYWAAHGVVAMHVQHIGSDRRLWTGGFGWSNSLNLVLRLQHAAQPEEAVDRTQDVRFALDQLLAGPLGPQFDPARLAIAGHSYGANTSLLLAGAKVSASSGMLGGAASMPALADPRFKAAILISAPPFYGEGDPVPILGGIAIPTLHISATDDEITIPGYYSGPADRVALFDATGGPHKALAMFSGGSHSIFTDRMNTGGFDLNPKVKAATRELSLAYLRLVLDGEDAPLRDWQRRHGALLARWQAP